MNKAISLAAQGKNVCFVDLDMTKPLFRSRDVSKMLDDKGISVCYSDQFMDAPVSNVGIEYPLKNKEIFTVLDVGGNETGARAIGRYRQILQDSGTLFYYVINPYRAWAGTIEHIDGVLGTILKAARVDLESIEFVANPNLGINTTTEDVIKGYYTLKNMLEPYAEISFCTAMNELSESAGEQIDVPVIPLELYLQYPWEK
ncbi:MAG: hypothetical protein IKR28_04625 [Selenomonadaceae bacterium]|nr:hypothetical protein [Selenomonadaceae bacterium]